MADATKLTESLAVAVTRGAESWQFFAFIFAALVTLAFAGLDEAMGGGWRRLAVKVAAFVVIGYFTLLSPLGRNFLVVVLNAFKVERH